MCVLDSEEEESEGWTRGDRATRKPKEEACQLGKERPAGRRATQNVSTLLLHQPRTHQLGGKDGRQVGGGGGGRGEEGGY